MQRTDYYLFFIWIVINFLSFEILGKEYTLIRLGTSYGGWTVPTEILNADSICYCAGAGEDISFDVALVTNFFSNVYIFDPTPRAIRHFEELFKRTRENKSFSINNTSETYKIKNEHLDKLHYFPFGLWNDDVTLRFYEPKNIHHVSHSITNLQKTNNFFEAPCHKLSTIMTMLHHEKIDLLKLDIEGAQWAVLDTIFDEHLDEKIRCICVEFDELAGMNAKLNTNTQATKIKAIEYLNKLIARGYKIIHQDGLVHITLIKD